MIFSDIKIDYVDHMGSDSSVSNSARVSFNKWKEEFDEKDEKLIKFLAREGHITPFRHNQIQIRCKVPIFLARQLAKHQAGLTWNEVSRRYVKDEPEFFNVGEWRAAPNGSIKQGSGAVHDHNDSLQEGYEEWMKVILNYYTKMIDNGVAPEMARMILPQSMMTEFIWTGNLLAFAHIYKLRADSHAQKEAQDFAEKLDNIIRPLFPVSWSALVNVEPE